MSGFDDKLATSLLELQRLCSRLSDKTYQDSLQNQLEALALPLLQSLLARTRATTKSSIDNENERLCPLPRPKNLHDFQEQLLFGLGKVAKDLTALRTTEVNRFLRVAESIMEAMQDRVDNFTENKCIGRKDEKKEMRGDKSSSVSNHDNPGIMRDIENKLRRTEQELLTTQIRCRELEHKLACDTREKERETAMLRQRLEHLLDTTRKQQSAAAAAAGNLSDIYTPKTPNHTASDVKDKGTKANGSSSSILRRVVNTSSGDTRAESSRVAEGGSHPSLATLVDTVERQLCSFKTSNGLSSSNESHMYKVMISRVRRSHEEACRRLERQHAELRKRERERHTKELEALRESLGKKCNEKVEEQEAEWVEAVKRLSLEHQEELAVLQQNVQEQEEGFKKTQAERDLLHKTAGELRAQVGKINTMRERERNVITEMHAVLKQREDNLAVIEKALAKREERTRIDTEHRMKQLGDAVEGEMKRLRKEYEGALEQAQRAAEKRCEEQKRILEELKETESLAWENERKDLETMLKGKSREVLEAQKSCKEMEQQVMKVKQKMKNLILRGIISAAPPHTSSSSEFKSEVAQASVPTIEGDNTMATSDGILEKRELDPRVGQHALIVAHPSVAASGRTTVPANQYRPDDSTIPIKDDKLRPSSIFSEALDEYIHEATTG